MLQHYRSNSQVFQVGVYVISCLLLGIRRTKRCKGSGTALLFEPFFSTFHSYGVGLLSCVFILRSIGDFKWVGFFKRKKGTVFAKWDTVLYSPLCFLLGTAILIIMFLRTA
ncbi:DUF3995 domain-containing protein [Paenibacillus sp. SER-28]